MILSKILAEKRVEIERKRAQVPIEELRARLYDAPPVRNFAQRLHRNEQGIPAVIAEIKKASPSKGLIRVDFDPVVIAKCFETAGASAISVLTDEKFFQGSLEYLAAVKAAVELPVLRKDFLIDEYQVVEARAAGADAILLIATALDKQALVELMTRAQDLGMQCLVEVHDEEDMATALDIGASLIGINNRNLNTFQVDLATTARLAAYCSVPKNSPRSQMSCDGDRGYPPASVPSRILISESGISTHEDMIALGKMSVDAVLIGETLMRSNDVGAKLKELIG